MRLLPEKATLFLLLFSGIFHCVEPYLFVLKQHRTGLFMQDLYICFFIKRRKNTFPALAADAVFLSAEEKSLHLVMGLIKGDHYGINAPPS